MQGKQRPSGIQAEIADRKPDKQCKGRAKDLKLDEQGKHRGKNNLEA